MLAMTNFPSQEDQAAPALRRIKKSSNLGFRYRKRSVASWDLAVLAKEDDIEETTASAFAEGQFENAIEDNRTPAESPAAPAPCLVPRDSSFTTGLTAVLAPLEVVEQVVTITAESFPTRLFACPSFSIYDLYFDESASAASLVDTSAFSLNSTSKKAVARSALPVFAESSSCFSLSGLIDAVIADISAPVTNKLLSAFDPSVSQLLDCFIDEIVSASDSASDSASSRPSTPDDDSSVTVNTDFFAPASFYNTACLSTTSFEFSEEEDSNAPLTTLPLRTRAETEASRYRTYYQQAALGLGIPNAVNDRLLTMY